jgi:hypothetical protein
MMTRNISVSFIFSFFLLPTCVFPSLFLGSGGEEMGDRAAGFPLLTIHFVLSPVPLFTIFLLGRVFDLTAVLPSTLSLLNLDLDLTAR